MNGIGLGPAIRGPLYFTLLISSIIVSYFLGRQSFDNLPIPSPQVFGVTSTQDAFKVTRVSVTGETISQIGCLYQQANFVGKITTTSPGTVSYKWEGDSNTNMSPILLVFDSAQTKEVRTSWQVYGAGQHWIKLHIVRPNDIASVEYPFGLECK